MFELSQIWALLQIEPGAGLLQSVILFGIWWNSRAIKKGIFDLGTRMNKTDQKNEARFVAIEGRLTKLEPKE